MPLIIKIKGGALLTALFIMTLVAIVATAMTTRLQLDIYRTRLIIMHDKLYLSSQAGTFWALSELNNKNNKFSKLLGPDVVAIYPKNLERIYNQVQVNATLYDMQARFNLNNLNDAKVINTFVLLGKTAPTAFSELESKTIAKAISNWISNYDIGRGKDSFTSYYLAQKPPYMPSHQLLQSYSEFRLVKDVTTSEFKSLESLVTVLPEPTAINANTASKSVLKSIAGGLSDSRVEDLISARGANGINNFNTLLKKLNIPGEQLTNESQYFLCKVHTQSDEFSLDVYTLFKRTRDQKGNIKARIIRQSFNGF